MDLAKTLIRTVVRAFYETRHVLVVDALMVHSALVRLCFVVDAELILSFALDFQTRILHYFLACSRKTFVSFVEDSERKSLLQCKLSYEILELAPLQRT